MRILLAGATGVIGRQTVPILTGAGHQVTGLARTPTRLPDTEVVAADALDPARRRRRRAGGRPRRDRAHVEALPTGQAMRRFGELDPARTAAALHLTC